MDPSTSTLLTGPVAITGAGGHVGRALQRRLADLPNPVRPLARSDDWASAIRDADAVIHLAGTLQPRPPDTYRAANLGTVERCVDALHGSTAQRVVLLSYVGADPGAANVYLRTKGQAEQRIGDIATSRVVLRSTYIYGDPHDIGPSFATYRTRLGGTVWILGDGGQRIAPIHVDDLVDVLVASALNPATPTGTFDLSGPTVSTLDAFVRHINPARVTIRHLPATAARLLAPVVPRLTPALVDVLIHDSVVEGDPREAAGRFGITLRHAPATE